MNDKRRIELRNADDLLSKASAIIQRAIDGEQDGLDNTPENFTYKRERMEDSVGNLESAISALESASDYLAEAMA